MSRTQNTNTRHETQVAQAMQRYFLETSGSFDRTDARTRGMLPIVSKTFKRAQINAVTKDAHTRYTYHAINDLLDKAALWPCLFCIRLDADFMIMVHAQGNAAYYVSVAKDKTNKFNGMYFHDYDLYGIKGYKYIKVFGFNESNTNNSATNNSASQVSANATSVFEIDAMDLKPTSFDVKSDAAKHIQHLIEIFKYNKGPTKIEAYQRSNTPNPYEALNIDRIKAGSNLTKKEIKLAIHYLGMHQPFKSKIPQKSFLTMFPTVNIINKTIERYVSSLKKKDL